ncbi:21570_t:CDS:2 [Rhizophagus irregularis]|nr:21570_t:CDS:2 [Rhizophagus irregularis]
MRDSEIAKERIRIRHYGLKDLKVLWNFRLSGWARYWFAIM